MDITKDINDAIAKNLPSAVGDELQKALAQGKADAAEVVTLTAKLAAANKATEEVKAQLATAHVDLTKHATLGVREGAVKGREDAISIRELQQELAAEKRISAFATDTVSRLVRNTDYRSTVNSAYATPIVVPQPGGYGTTMVHQTQQKDERTQTAE